MILGGAGVQPSTASMAIGIITGGSLGEARVFIPNSDSWKLVSLDTRSL